MKHSRYLCIGPGGRKCICCFPAPGSKARKLEYRKAKRIEKREAMKIEFGVLRCAGAAISLEN